jgi:anaerobic selenocysteine-containing dehydrogenase
VALTIQVPGTGYVHKGAFVRLAGLANWTIHHGYDQNGDLPMFWPMTFGVQTEELESTEWPYARYTMVFGSNIMQTRLPDAQHLLRAKRNGKLVVFDPDYCSTAAKADEWVALKPDTDAALGLAMAKVIIDRKLYDPDFLKDFTDMPILVRKDNGKRILASQVRELSKKARAWTIPEYRSLYVIHNGKGLTILNPEDLRPANAVLDGEYEVELTDGSTVEVRTVFNELKLLRACACHLRRQQLSMVQWRPQGAGPVPFARSHRKYRQKRRRHLLLRRPVPHPLRSQGVVEHRQGQAELGPLSIFSARRRQALSQKRDQGHGRRMGQPL